MGNHGESQGIVGILREIAGNRGESWGISRGTAGNHGEPRGIVGNVRG